MAAKLTDIALRNAQPRAKKYKLSLGHGLTLMVMPDGAKYWRLRYRFAGREKEISLGRPYPELSLKDAWTETSRMRVMLDDEIDPAEQRFQKKLARKQRAESTFEGAAEAWFAYHDKAWRDRTKAQVRMYLDKDLLPTLGKRPLDLITTKELAAFARKIEERGAPDVAKKVRQWLAKIFAFARAEGLTTADPVRDLRAIVLRSPEGYNYPHLGPKDLQEFLLKLDAFKASTLVKGAAMMLLWTACRPGVTRTLRWSELDLENADWKIPRGRAGMKRGYAHVSPLPRQAVAMLRETYKTSGTFEYVFIGRNNPRKPLSDGAINVLLKRLGYQGRQVGHGFRHLIKTALSEAGYPKEWSERQLSHSDPDKMSGTYDKAMFLEDRRVMMQAWADYLDELRAGAPFAPFKRSA